MTEDAISEMLLAYAQGRLSDEEQASVEQYVSANPAHAEELEFYKGLARTGELSKTQTIPNELGWKRLSKAIDSENISMSTSLQAANTNQPLWRYDKTDSFDVQVTFAPTTTEREFSDLLRSIKGEIVSGPTAIGLYTVRFTSEAQQENGLQHLREATDIIENASKK